MEDLLERHRRWLIDCGDYLYGSHEHSHIHRDGSLLHPTTHNQHNNTLEASTPNRHADKPTNRGGILHYRGLHSGIVIMYQNQHMVISNKSLHGNFIQLIIWVSMYIRFIFNSNGNGIYPQYMRKNNIQIIVEQIK